MQLPYNFDQITPGRITLAYAVLGLGWIFWSDMILLQIVDSRQTLSTIQTVKGGLFVAISGAVIWGLTSRRENQLHESQSRLLGINQRLHVLQRVIRHNIRNDLNVIKGRIDLAQENAEEPTRSHLDVANSTADDIVEISEKLRIMDRFELDADISDTIEMVHHLENAITESRMEHPRVTFETEIPKRKDVIGDESIYYIFEEVLDNAVRHYQGEIQTIQIDVQVDDRLDRVEVCISDNGPGISDGEIEAIRKGTESSLVHLSGVGLWVVYWLCERIDAELEIQSDATRGTDVTISFRKPASMPDLSLVGEEFLESGS